MRNRKANIMVVDDDERTLRLMVAMLVPQGYEVIMARDGQEAIDISLKNKPDLVLMDMMMPNMDGLTACQAIKTNKTTQQIPVVMVTSVGGEYNVAMAKTVWGVDGYITKPVDLAELKGTIARLLS